MEISIKNKFDLKLNFWFLTIFFIVILAVFLFNLGTVSAVNSFLGKRLAENEEAKRPANLEITVIKDSSCGDCFSVDSILETIKNENVSIISEKNLEAVDAEAIGIINKFKITKVPALLVAGELTKNQKLSDLLSKMGEIRDGTFVLAKIGAPYVLATSGDVRGRVKLTLLSDKSCEECYNVTQHDTILRNFGLNTEDQEIIDINSTEGKKLVKQYKIKLVPTFVLTGEVSEFPALLNVWPSVGTVEEDGSYVFREGVKQMGAYKDLNTGKSITPPPQEG